MTILDKNCHSVSDYFFISMTSFIWFVWWIWWIWLIWLFSLIWLIWSVSFIWFVSFVWLFLFVWFVWFISFVWFIWFVSFVWLNSERRSRNRERRKMLKVYQCCFRNRQLVEPGQLRLVAPRPKGPPLICVHCLNTQENGGRWCFCCFSWQHLSSLHICHTSETSRRTRYWPIYQCSSFKASNCIMSGKTVSRHRSAFFPRSAQRPAFTRLIDKDRATSEAL